MSTRLFPQRLLVRLLAVHILVLAAFGQAIDGSLVGTVTDPSGAAVTKAQVIATNRDTSVKLITATNDEGQYRLGHLAVGTYEVRATAPGFATNSTENVALQLNRTATVNFTLEIASQATSIQVTQSAAPIDLANSQLQINLQSRALVDIPSAAVGSGFYNLSLLGAGVGSSGGLGLGVGPSVAGQRPSGNRFLIEGADDNSYFAPGPIAVLSNDAISEFTLLQNHFGPEFGGAVGGVFNAIVKSGGNQVHGSIYEYFQNRNLNALDAMFARQKFTAPPRFDYNRFGGTVGGPIIKEKLFYFANYEYNPVGNASAATTTVFAPTAAGYQLLNSLAGVSKTNLGVLQSYIPAADATTKNITVNSASIPVGPIPVSGPSYQNAHHAIGRLDWNASDRDQLHARYVYSGSEGTDPNSTTTLPVFYATAPSVTNLASLTHVHTFSATQQNELRAAYSRNNTRRAASNDLTFPGLDSFPTITFRELSLQLGPKESVPNGQVQGQLQLSDNFVQAVGRHTLKFGVDFRDLILSTSFLSNPRGFYQYSSLGAYLQDISPEDGAARTMGTNGPLVGGLPAGFLQTAFYANDDFRVRSNLTLNLGVRYEYVTVPVMLRAQSYSSIADVPGVLTFSEPNSVKTEWSPRLGFAYSPGRSGLWSIRGGFSRSYDTPYANIASNTVPAFYGSAGGVPPNSATPNFLANGGVTQPSSVLATPESARSAISSYTYDQRRPYAINYTLSVQRLLGNDYTLEARYLGTRGVHLLVQRQINRNSLVSDTRYLPTYLNLPATAQLAALPLTLGDIRGAANSNNPLLPYGFNNSGAITAYEPRGNSQYHGLALQVTKRYSKSFSYLAAYTWSHAFDDSTATVNTTALTPRRPQNFNDLRSEWATSMLDHRHRFTITPIIDIKPFGRRNWMLKNVVGNWTTAFTYTYESPSFVTVQSGSDSNLNGDSATDRAIVNGSGNPAIGSGVTGYDRNGTAIASNAATAVQNTIVAYVANNSNAGYLTTGLGALANGGRNTFALDPINNIDLNVTKRFDVGESRRLEFGAQFFNLLNHSQYTGGFVNDVYLSKALDRNFLLPSNAAFGNYKGSFASNSRWMQLTARFTF